jgi:hypothetical protein
MSRTHDEDRGDLKADMALKKLNKTFMDLGSNRNELEKAAKDFEAAAAAAGMSGERTRQAIEMIEKARDKEYGKDALSQKFAESEEMTKDVTGLHVGDTAMPDIKGDADDAVALWIETYQKASEAHNEGALKAGAAVLEGSKVLQDKLIESGAIADGAIENLSSMIKDSTLKHLVQGQEKSAADQLKASSSNLNMYGGQTFHIRQDFRDQNPDNVAIVFRKDVARSAISRTQARLASYAGA